MELSSMLRDYKDGFCTEKQAIDFIQSQVAEAVNKKLTEVEEFHRFCGRQDMNELRAWQALASGIKGKVEE